MTTLAEKIQMVVEYSGVDNTVAETALLKYDQDVITTLVELSVPPKISGTKHIPPPPVVHDGHDAETKERIVKGRLLADILSAAPQNDLRGKATHYPPRLASVTEDSTAKAVAQEVAPSS